MMQRSKHLLFGAFTIALAVLNRDSLQALAALSRQDATASHLPFIPVVTIALLFRLREKVFAAPHFSSGRAEIRSAAALITLVGLGALAGWLRLLVDGPDMLSAAISVLVVTWICGFAICYGRSAFWAGLFPLLFLLFMIPIPPAVLEWATLLLKKGSAEVVAGLFTVTGTPFHRSDYIFALPRLTIEIADQCSGIRSSIALVLTSLLAGHLFLETAWKKVLLAAVVIPFAVLKNGFRIVSLSLLGNYVDAGFITGPLHHEGGIVFYLLGLAVLAPFFLILCNSDKALIREHL